MGATRVIIEGTFESDRLETHELVIGRTGAFRGSAQVHAADIDGRFNGDIAATGRLGIRANGNLIGSAEYGALVVEEGGMLTATMEVLSDS